MDPTSNGTLEDFPAELRTQASAALDAERQSIEKGIDAWKKLVGVRPRPGNPGASSRALQASRALEGMRRDPEGSCREGGWPIPDAKVPLLLEMVEIYRDRLKLDVNVIDSYNRILAIQPATSRSWMPWLRSLKAARIRAGPTSSLFCARKPPSPNRRKRKVALQLRVANLYLEKFQNQAEAIKCFEAILEIDSANPDAVSFLKQMYEKRRDWERLIAVLRQEVGRIADPAEQARRWAEVAKLATEKLKKAAVSIELWSKVIELERERRRGAGRA
jgi:tetratricopeptide (TPR) repeat protein